MPFYFFSNYQKCPLTLSEPIGIGLHMYFTSVDHDGLKLFSVQSLMFLQVLIWFTINFIYELFINALYITSMANLFIVQLFYIKNPSRVLIDWIRQ